MNLNIEGRFMASNTKQLKAIRKNKKTKMGTRRKAANRNKGTTPKFAVHQNKEK